MPCFDKLLKTAALSLACPHCFDSAYSQLAHSRDGNSQKYTGKCYSQGGYTWGSYRFHAALAD